MTDPLEDLIRLNNEFYDRLITENNELDRAFQSGTFGQLVQSWSKDDGAGNDDTGAGESTELEGEAGGNVVEGEDRGASGEPEAIG